MTEARVKTSKSAAAGGSNEAAEADNNWEKFFVEVAPPPNYDEAMSQVRAFVKDAASGSKKLVLVTSGGTTVPLERLTVRYVDNFSSGARGAASTEYFLQKGYKVIFLFRQKSLEPFARHLPSVLDVLELEGEAAVKVASSQASKVRNLLERYVKYKSSCLKVPYESLGDYLWLLKGISMELNSIHQNAMLYLAAAVADFYVPPSEMPEHKIHSETKPGISFSLVPKMLRPLRTVWAPKAFIVSFKLETDEGVILERAKQALTNYQHDMVIANILTTRKKTVTAVDKTGNAFTITMANPSETNEIESLLINFLADKHQLHILETGPQQSSAA